MHSKGRVDGDALVGLPGLEAAERQLEDVIEVDPFPPLSGFEPPDRMLWMPWMVLGFIGWQTCGRQPVSAQSWPGRDLADLARPAV